MGAPTLPVRCLACGATVPSPGPTAATAWVRCAACGHPVPVVPVRDPAPLFSWEVFPNLYPPAPPPDRPTPGLRAVLLAFLLAGTVTLLALTAVSAGGGALAFSPGPFTVTGTVLGAPVYPALPAGNATPVSGATVVLTPESGAPQTERTAANGGFSFHGVAPGRVLLNVTAPGYVPMSAVLFASAVYASAGSPAQPLVLELASTASGVAASTPIYEGPWGDLESLVASFWSATVLLGIGATVAAFGTLALARDRRPALSLSGGAAIAAAPVSIFLLNLNTAIPVLGAVAGGTLLVGTAIVALFAVGMAAEGRALEPE